MIHPNNKRKGIWGWELFISAPSPKKTDVAVDESRAKDFLGPLKRQRRQLWHRTRPEVQQWYQQFLYMGFDEAVGVLSCWGWLPARHVCVVGGWGGETGL